MKQRDIFIEAIQKEEREERCAFLNAACGDDVELRDSVEELLAEHQKNDSFFLDAPPPGLDATIDQPISEKLGTQIGPYKLREQIGEGGFGVVYVAEQIKPVRRKVALKVIKPGMDTKEVIARFEAERQALALMDHPNVASVLDAGTTAPTEGGYPGRPYFVMELVQGVPITEFCDQQRLSTNQRLRLFVDVCQAVQHAHQKGIIHRDIKPSNVMVTMYDHRPVVKVIDFGVAKAIGCQLTEKTIYTAYGQMVGTPMYMSPEQAQMSGLDVDTRSDVYSLGVLVYELLTGSPPFDKENLHKAGFDEMRRIIIEEEPRRPSVRVSTLHAEQLSTVSDQRKIDAGRLSQSLQGELDWIVMKGLEKDRSRRYETPASLADDVDRYLNDEAVQACPPTMAYRLSKFARRHKAALGVAAAMVVLLLGGIAATTWQAVRATSEKDRAVAAEGLADQRLEESEEARARSEKDREAAVAAQKKAEEARAQSDKDREAAVAARENAEVALRESSEISGFLTDLLKKARPGEEGGGRDVKLVELLDIAVKRLDHSTKISPDRVNQLRGTIGTTYQVIGFYKEAIELREKVLNHVQQSRGPGHPATIGPMIDLADSYRKGGRNTESERLLEDALALSREHLGENHITTIRAKGALANCFQTAGRWDAALAMREDVLEQCRAVLGADHGETSGAMHNLSISLVHAERFEEACELSAEAVRILQKSRGRDSPATLVAMDSLAANYHRSGDGEKAADLREEILPLSRKVYGPDDPFTLLMMNNLANSCHLAGRQERELEMREELLAARNKILGPDDPKTLRAMRILARRYEEAGRRDEAQALREEQKRLRTSSQKNRPEKVDK